MYRLEVNGQRIEAPDLSVVLNFQTNDLGEVAVKGSGSQTLLIPKTVANIAAFGYCNFVESETAFPYTIHAARCYQDELLLIDGAEFTILRTTADGFETALTWGNSPMLNALKNTYICEVPLGVYRKMPLESPQPGDTVAFAEAFHFVEQNNEGETTDHFTTMKFEGGLFDGVYRDAIPSFVYVKDVLTKLATRAGLGLVIIDDEAENNLEGAIVLETSKSATIPVFRLHSRITDRTIDLARWEDDGNKLSSYKRLYGDDPEAYHVDEPYRGQVDDVSYYQEMRDYYIPQDGFYDFRVEVSYKQGQVGEPDGHGGVFGNASSVNIVFAGAQGYLYDNGTGFDRVIRTNQPDLNDTQDIRGDQTRLWIDADEVTGLVITKQKQYYKKGRHALWLIMEGGNQTSYEAARFTEVNLELDITRHNNEPTTVVDEQECYLDRNFVFRDATAYTVLSQTLKAFGFLAQVEGDKLVLYTYNTLKESAKAGEGVDWSSRVIGDAQSHEYSLDLAQFIALRWKAEAQYNGGKDAEIEILSTKSGRQDYLNNSIYSAANGMIHHDEIPLDFPEVNYLSRKTDTPLVRDLVSYVSGAKMAKFTGVDFIGGYGMKVWRKLDDGSYTSFTITGDYFLGVADDYFDYSDTETGIGANFATLLDALHRITFLKVPARLTPLDLATLDFKRPVFLQTYNAYFAIDKIKYGEGGVSSLDLIKLNI